MAPFKLKFRMGNSRSTSQEHDPDPQVNEALLNHHAATMGASSSTIDSADGNSLGSLNTNERKSLLPNKNNNLRMGFITQSNFATHEADESEECNVVPVTPPPSYEHVLEEKTYENAHQQQQCAIEEPVVTQQQLQRGNSNQSIGLELLSITCKEPDCDYQEHHLQRQLTNSSTNSNNNITHNNNINNNNNNNKNSTYNEQISEQSNTEDKFTNMSGPSTSAAAGRVQYMSEYNGDCQECENEANSQHCQNDQNIYYQREGSYSQIYEEPRNYNEQHMDDNDTGNEDEWHLNQHHQQQQQHHQQQQEQQRRQQQQEQQRRQQQQAQQEYERSMTPEIISNKSSKEIYKDLAKQWGITCKMSDGCRCMECQSHYFDCEFDDNDHQKTDGGLGAGTPMFISEVMHGTACNIL